MRSLRRLWSSTLRISAKASGVRGLQPLSAWQGAERQDGKDAISCQGFCVLLRVPDSGGYNLRLAANCLGIRVSPCGLGIAPSWDIWPGTRNSCKEKAAQQPSNDRHIQQGEASELPWRDCILGRYPWCSSSRIAAQFCLVKARAGLSWTSINDLDHAWRCQAPR